MRFKHFIFLAALWAVGIAYLFGGNQHPDFSSIWSKGYVDGWCYDVEGHCIEPIVPIPPQPRIKDTTYTIIYNRGFLAGRKANR